jgi:uracil-DNA glycosylase family 4
MTQVDWETLYELHYQEHDRNSNSDSDLSNIYVAGEGDNPRVMIIGEAPGAQEEMHQRPFIGPAGYVLRQLMDSVGLSADSSNTVPEDGWSANCWLTNVVKFRPPRNRTPTEQEIITARPWLRAEWNAIGRPTIIVPVGKVPLRAVTGKWQSILACAGRLHKVRSTKSGLEFAVWPMIHPAFGLRTPQAQDLIERDWEKFGEWLNAP